MGYFFLAIPVVVAIVIWFFFGGKCPACRRTHAIERTGRIQKRGFFYSDLEEWKCKYCGHRMWRKESSGGGGGGDGGDGGDGG